MHATTLSHPDMSEHVHKTHGHTCALTLDLHAAQVLDAPEGFEAMKYISNKVNV